MKSGIIGSVILFVVVLVLLVTPWYPVSVSKQIPQTNTYTVESTLLISSYKTQTSFGQSQTAYTLSSPESLTGSCGVACWVSQSFSLQPGTINVTVTQCATCAVFIDNTNGTFNAAIAEIGPLMFFAQAGLPQLTTIRTAKVVDAGNYVIVLGNMGASSGTVSGVVVVFIPTSLQVASGSSELVQTATLYTRTNLIIYSQSSVPVYTAIGILPSVSIVVLVALVVAFVILVDQKRINLSAKHRRKQSHRRTIS